MTWFSRLRAWWRWRRRKTGLIDLCTAETVWGLTASDVASWQANYRA